MASLGDRTSCFNGSSSNSLGKEYGKWRALNIPRIKYIVGLKSLGFVHFHIERRGLVPNRVIILVVILILILIPSILVQFYAGGPPRT
jgi:hypothetical protein